MSINTQARIELTDELGVSVVSVIGELDVSNVDDLERATFALPNHAGGIVLDLRQASYIDSSTLGLLFRLQHSLERRGQALRVVCTPGSSPERVMQLTGFDRKIACETDCDTAVAAIRREVSIDDG
jgi:anti-anti-sigma factor